MTKRVQPRAGQLYKIKDDIRPQDIIHDIKLECRDHKWTITKEQVADAIRGTNLWCIGVSGSGASALFSLTFKDPEDHRNPFPPGAECLHLYSAMVARGALIDLSDPEQQIKVITTESLEILRQNGLLKTQVASLQDKVVRLESRLNYREDLQKSLDRTRSKVEDLTVDRNQLQKMLTDLAADYAEKNKLVSAQEVEREKLLAAINKCSNDNTRLYNEVLLLREKVKDYESEESREARESVNKLIDEALLDFKKRNKWLTFRNHLVITVLSVIAAITFYIIIWVALYSGLTYFFR